MEIEVPDDHRIGMKVPRGGSNCAKCEYVSEDLKNCHNHYFQRFNGGNAKLPEKADRYCCDLFQANEE